MIGRAHGHGLHGLIAGYRNPHSTGIQESGAGVESFHVASKNVHEAGRLFAQSLEDSRLGDQDGVDGQAEFRRDVRGRAAVLDLALEGPPCRRLELEADRLQQGPGDVAIVFLVPGTAQGAGRVGQLGQGFVLLRIAGGGPPTASFFPVPAQAMDRDRPQPGPEGTGPLVVGEVRQIHEERGQDLLDHILGVGGLRDVRADPPPDEGLVELQMCAWSPEGATLATVCGDLKTYLWDAATGTRKATVEGYTNGGLRVAFHPAGTLLASNGWESQLRLWDAALGRPVLSLTDSQPGGFGLSQVGFSQDGRVVVSVEDQLTTYQVEPALEYRTFAHAFGQPTSHFGASIRRDGRLLAVGTDRGVAIWDLATGTELPFLPIGQTWYVVFEASGDLLTLNSGSLSAQRWPVHIDPSREEFRIGPPRRLPLPGGNGIAEDRSGGTVAVARHDHALVSTAERTIRVAPLDDCRYVAVSPDGRWLATGSHDMNGAQV
jgi:hypothetical protein